MEIILFTFNAVMPLFLLTGVGMLLRRTGYMDDAFATQLNRICFVSMIPFILFRTTYTSEFRLSSLFLVAYVLIAYFVIIVLACLLVPRLFPDPRQVGAIVQGMFRSNLTLLGLPLIINVLGEDHTAPMALLIVFLAPSFSVAGAIVLTIFSEREGKISIGHLLKEIIKNPLIIGALLGLACNFLGVRLPSIIMKPVNDLATIASPIAMIAMGARFNLKSFSSNRRAIAFASLGRLVVIPGLMTLGGILLGFRGDALCALFIATGTPAAAAGVAMADAMGSDGKLSGEIVMTTTACSCITLFTGVCILLATGLI